MGRPKTRDALELDRIIEAAWRVVDRDGLAALSTRNVAAELSVKGPALYWHVKSKQELLSRMIEQMLRHSVRTPPADLPWWEWLRAYSREVRHTMLAHRNSGLIAATASPSDPVRTEIMPELISRMVDAGLPSEEAGSAVGILASFVLGCVIYEQGTDTRALALAFNDPALTFENGLDFIIAGLRLKAESLATARPKESRR